MGKIVIKANVSLDGVVEDPDGHEGFRLGGWFGKFASDKEMCRTRPAAGAACPA